ncbi:MAG: hypothetical protein HOP29_08470 [Phycisphaerales bacterium]|nr:hypothetical protein [Phycisphaerales bacterium]
MYGRFLPFGPSTAGPFHDWEQDMLHLLRLSVFSITIMGALATDSLSQVCELEKVVASDADPLHAFGAATAIDGLVAIVGDPGNGDVAPRAGAAYVYEFENDAWVEKQKLTAVDGAEDDFLGESVAISGNVIVAGARRHDSSGEEAGAVYVYRFNGSAWVQEQKLTASNAESLDEFGEEVAIDGNIIVVGAPFFNIAGAPPGSAYIFRFDGNSWLEEQELVAGVSGDRFGTFVAIDADVIAVGAPMATHVFGDAGEAYVFRHDGNSWQQEQLLFASDFLPGDHFGSTMAVEMDTVIAVSPERQNGGVAYVFHHNTGAWSQVQTLNAGSIGLGLALRLREPWLILSSPSDSEVAKKAGAAFVYKNVGGTWTLFQKLTASDGAVEDRLGEGATINEHFAIVSSTRTAGGAGAFYAYPLGPDCNANTAPDLCDLHLQTSTDCDGNYVPDECDSPDCNANSLPDECDLVSGVSFDCDGDSVPDECVTCTMDCHCHDHDVCSQDSCDVGVCLHMDRVFGDANFDGAVDIFDILCVLDGFAGAFTPPCTLSNLDLSPCPGGDGGVDIFDILGVLDAFSGVNVCGCLAGP